MHPDSKNFALRTPGRNYAYPKAQLHVPMDATTRTY